MASRLIPFLKESRAAIELLVAVETTGDMVGPAMGAGREGTGTGSGGAGGDGPGAGVGT